MALDIENIAIKSIVWSPVFQMAVMSGGVFISFLISYFKGDISIYMPFISETGAIIPEMGIFSATLVFGSFTGAVMVFYRYAIVSYMVSKENPRVLQANMLCLLCGIVSMAGLVGVAAFPMSSSVAIHVGAAAVHFGPILLYFYLNAYISMNAVPPYYNKLLFIFRLVLSLILSVLLLLLSVLLGVGHFTWIKIYPTRLHATKTPEDEVFWVLFCGALFEWFAYGVYLAYTLTFMLEFRKFSPELSVRPLREMVNAETGTK